MDSTLYRRRDESATTFPVPAQLGLAFVLIAFLVLASITTGCTRVAERLPGAPADPSGTYAVSWDGLPGTLSVLPFGDLRSRGYPCSANGDRVLGVGIWTYAGGRLHAELVSLDGLTYVRLDADVRGDQFEGEFAATVANQPCASGDTSGVREP